MPAGRSARRSGGQIKIPVAWGSACSWLSGHGRKCYQKRPRPWQWDVQTGSALPAGFDNTRVNRGPEEHPSAALVCSLLSRRRVYSRGRPARRADRARAHPRNGSRTSCRGHAGERQAHGAHGTLSPRHGDALGCSCTALRRKLEDVLTLRKRGAPAQRDGHEVRVREGASDAAIRRCTALQEQTPSLRLARCKHALAVVPTAHNAACRLCSLCVARWRRARALRASAALHAMWRCAPPRIREANFLAA